MIHAFRSTISRVRYGLLVVALGLLAAGCGSFSNAGEGSAEQQKAQELVSSAHAAGVAPHLTVEVAEALYGNDAAGVCKAFEGGLTTSERNDVLGNPANRRPKTITTDAITYGRLVVKTYCPDELSRYDAIVKDLNPVDSD